MRCPDRKRPRKTVITPFWSAIKVKLPYTMAVRSLFGGGSVIETFAVANKMIRGGASVLAAPTFVSPTVALFPGMSF